MTAVLERAREAVRPVGEAVGRTRSVGPPPVRRAALVVAVVVLWAVLDNVLTKGLPLGIILLGAVFGSLYAVTAIGIVLVFRANRVVNFAQAEFGAVAGVLAIEFVFQWRMNYFLAIFLGLVIAVVMGAVLNTLVIRRFRKAPRLILAVATIGLAQLLNGISVVIPILWGGLAAGRFETPFSFRFTVYPVIFNGNHLVAMIVVPAIMLGLAAFLRFSDYGVAIRAAAENGDRSSLLGIPVPRLSTIVWGIAGFLSAVAVLLRVPLVGFASFNSVSAGGPSLLLRTLAAAVIARMESLPRTVVAAVSLGIFEYCANWTVPRTTVVDAMLVLIILVALLVQRDFFSRAAETGISSWRAIKEVRPIPEELRDLAVVKYTFLALRGLILAFALFLPVWASPSQEQTAGLIIIYSMVAVSLLVLTGWAGHISLGQWALVGFGAAGTSLMYGRYGWDFLVAMPFGVGVAAVVALVIGLPALRIRGPFLAVTTLAFAVTAFNYFLEDRYFPWFIQESINRPTLWNRLPLEDDWQMYYFSLVGLLLVIVGVRNLRRSHTGRALIAVRDNETAAESVTLNTTRLKLIAFVISGALAGFAGAFYVVHQRGLHTDAFGPEVSLRLFSMVVIGGLGSLPGAILGAVYVRGAEFFLPAGWESIATGTGILFLLMFLPEGLGGVIYGIRDAFLRRVAKQRGLVVPSLLADVRQQQVAEEEARLTIGTALGGLAAAHEPSGNGTDDADERTADEDQPPQASTGNGRRRSRRTKTPTGTTTRR